MNFDPQKLFIGLMDFFSILLPGALLAWLWTCGAGTVALEDRFAMLVDAGAWAVFLFESYRFGRPVCQLGALLDEFYDWTRRTDAQSRRWVVSKATE